MKNREGVVVCGLLKVCLIFTLLLGVEGVESLEAGRDSGRDVLMKANTADIISNKQCEERSRAIELENMDSMLENCACRASRVFGADFFRKFQSSLTLKEKMDIFLQGVDDYASSSAKQQREAIEVSELLAVQNKSLISRIERQEERIEELENKLFIKESQGKVVSPVVTAEKESSASIETKKVESRSVDLGERCSYSGDFEGDTIHGMGIFINHRHAFDISGSFVHGCLDLTKPIKFEGYDGMSRQFQPNASSDKELKIEVSALMTVKSTSSANDSLYLMLSPKQAKREGIVFNEKFVYRGALDDYRRPNGNGVMIRNTGEIRSGNLTYKAWLQD